MNEAKTGGQMSEKQESTLNDGENVIPFSKSQMRRIAKETSHDIDEITDEDFQVFLNALFGKYKGPGWNPE